MAEPQRKHTKFETSPERLACIWNVLDKAYDASSGQICDAFSDDGKLRAFAEALRIPFMALEMSSYGREEFTDDDIDEYVAWRAQCASAKKKAAN